MRGDLRSFQWQLHAPFRYSVDMPYISEMGLLHPTKRINVGMNGEDSGRLEKHGRFLPENNPTLRPCVISPLSLLEVK